MTRIIRFICTTLAALLLAATGNAAFCAEAWPSRSIRFIVPYPPGGPTDLMARSMSGRLSEALGQTVVVDNRPGAGGNVGAATIGETLPGYEAYTWFGVLVPAGTPQPIVERLSRESMRILQSEEIRKRFAEVGAEPVGGTPQQFAAFMAAETIKWAKVIKASGARID